jgi:hypothetical protein
MLLIVAISQYLIFYRNTLRNRFMIFMYLDIQLMARSRPLRAKSFYVCCRPEADLHIAAHQ